VCQQYGRPSPATLSRADPPQTKFGEGEMGGYQRATPERYYPPQTGYLHIQSYPPRNWEGRQLSPQRDCRGGLVVVDRPVNNADAPPQPRYRGLTLPKRCLGRVKWVAFSERLLNGTTNLKWGANLK
jgi:hypothetical protein